MGVVEWREERKGKNKYRVTVIKRNLDQGTPQTRIKTGRTHTHTHTKLNLASIEKMVGRGGYKER